jgi:hypothetical protein
MQARDALTSLLTLKGVDPVALETLLRAVLGPLRSLAMTATAASAVAGCLPMVDMLASAFADPLHDTSGGPRVVISVRAALVNGGCFCPPVVTEQDRLGLPPGFLLVRVV